MERQFEEAVEFYRGWLLHMTGLADEGDGVVFCLHPARSGVTASSAARAVFPRQEHWGYRQDGHLVAPGSACEVPGRVEYKRNAK